MIFWKFPGGVFFEPWSASAEGVWPRYPLPSHLWAFLPTWQMEVREGIQKTCFLKTFSKTEDPTHPPHGFKTIRKISRFSNHEKKNYASNCQICHLNSLGLLTPTRPQFRKKSWNFFWSYVFLVLEILITIFCRCLEAIKKVTNFWRNAKS